MSSLTRTIRVGVLLSLFGLMPSAVLAQDPDPAPAEQQPQQPVRVEETVVVSATKVEQQLINAPATITVIGPQTLDVAPSLSYADILRAVPGVNVTQISARDVNLTPRGSTST